MNGRICMYNGKDETETNVKITNGKFRIHQKVDGETSIAVLTEEETVELYKLLKELFENE